MQSVLATNRPCAMLWSVRIPTAAIAVPRAVGSSKIWFVQQ